MVIKNYLEAAIVLGLVLGAYYGLQALNVIPDNFAISENLSLWGIFVLGLVAATSTCIAVSGGFLLALSAKHAENNPNLRGLQKFQPHIYFNVGRILSYGFFGGAIGALGKTITISPFVNGLIIIGASALMIVLGFGMLNIFRRLYALVPNFGRLGDIGPERGAFLGGAATFFLPCGFTQALQLYVLSSSAGALFGAKIMTIFALGTLPALISVGALTSIIKGSAQKYFMKFAGAIVLLIGLSSLPNGLSLAGFTGLALFSDSVQPISNEELKLGGQGAQVVRMKVVGLEYEPANFTVKKGVPVEWLIDGSGARGCARVIVAPKLRLSVYLKPAGVKKITFTPEETGFIGFSCSMGMTTPGAGFKVVD